MEPVERYLNTVRRYLPAFQRDDIVAELSANLSAAIHDRSLEHGHALDEAQIEAMLRAHGHPIAVALRFASANGSFSFGRQLVGPALFPFYVRILALQMLVACFMAIVAARYAIPTWTGVPNILAHVVLQCTIVTIVFVALQAAIDRGRDSKGKAVGRVTV